MKAYKNLPVVREGWRVLLTLGVILCTYGAGCALLRQQVISENDLVFATALSVLLSRVQVGRLTEAAAFLVALPLVTWLTLGFSPSPEADRLWLVLLLSGSI